MRIDEAPTSRRAARERWAAEIAHEAAIEDAFCGPGGRHAADLVAYYASGFGKSLGARAAGTYVMAYISVLQARAIENHDLCEESARVADEWWSTHDRSAAPYGAPWSPGGAR